MISLRVAFPLLVALPVAACGPTMAARQFNSDREIAQVAVSNLKQCGETVYTTPKFSPLGRHTSLSTAGPSTAQMADTSYATEADVKLLGPFEDQLADCGSSFGDELSQIDPRLGNIVDEGHRLDQQNAALLMNHEETWGQFNQNLSQIGDKLAEAVLSITTADSNELRRENDAEIAQRQRAWANFSAALQRQEMINAANRPITTTCNRFGFTVDCTSD